MLLQYGISGYRNSEKAELPITDFKEFKKTCHLVSVCYGGRVLGFREAYRYPDSTSNYHLAWLSHKYQDEKVIIVFLNAHYPLVAFAVSKYSKAKETLPERGSWQSVDQVFEDSEAISVLFERYQLVKLHDLQEPLLFRMDNQAGRIVLETPHELDEAEVEMIHHWHKTLAKPSTVGDVLFNWWD